MAVIPIMRTPQEFYDFYFKIPEEKWCVDTFFNGTQCCVSGHLGMSKYHHKIKKYKNASENNCQLAALFMMKNIDVMLVNDNHLFKYNQSTPKQRVLAALIDLGAIAK